MAYTDKLDPELEALMTAVYQAGLEVHKYLGPGMLESAYKAAYVFELQRRHISVETEVSLSIDYKGLLIPNAYRIDILAERKLPIELKAIETLLPQHVAQLLTYMKFGGFELGLLINFNAKLFKHGAQRVVL